MIAEWVLILWLFGYREYALTTHTFTSFERCEKARNHMRGMAPFMPTSPQIHGICVER